MNKLKRLSGLAMVIVLILSLFAATAAYAEENADTPDPMEQEPGPPSLPPLAPLPPPMAAPVPLLAVTVPP